MNLKIMLSSDNAPLLPALVALKYALSQFHAELYCLCDNREEAMQIQNVCECDRKSEIIESYTIFSRQDFNSVLELANHLLLNGVPSGDILFLSSNVILEKDALIHMVDFISSDDLLAGANPILTADWIHGDEERIAFMGMTFDFQKKLHFLHEGIYAENWLTQRERFFQIAHPGCLLMRSSDFAKIGGFKVELGFLAFPEFCFQLRNLRPKGYACISAAKGRLKDKYDSWNFCGAWDSILQRGRLETGGVNADYADFCIADGIEYEIDRWLVESPSQIQDLSAIPAVKYWQEWRYHPRPRTLLSFISSLSAEERIYAVELTRNRPASLPQTLQYYKVQADKIKGLVKDRYIHISTQIDAWRTKIRRFHYGELRPGIQLLKKTGIYNCSLDSCPAIFDAWVETSERFEKLEISDSWPEIAVAMPVWNPRPAFLRQAIESVLKQVYPNWKLYVADDASTKSEIRPILESFAREDTRIKVKFREKNGHICRATNSALEMVEEPFTAFLDHDDLLSPYALGEVARTIARKPDLGFIYTDDDRISEENVRRNPVFKPDFDCDLFYTGHLSTYDTGLIRKLGGLRVGTEGSQDQDLRFRVVELLDHRRIAHIPRILYHWRVHEESTASSFLAKPYVFESGRKVYLDAATRQGRNAEWGDKDESRLFRLLYYPGRRYRCAVIFMVDESHPSRLLLDVVKDLEKYIDVAMYAQYLKNDLPRLRDIPSLPYVDGGYARVLNEAVERIDSDVAIFLSASLEPDRDCRLEQLVELAMRPHVAMASGNIWCHDRLASGGWYPDADGMPFQLLQGTLRKEVKNSVWGQIFLPRHVLGAPWECLAVKRNAYQSGKFLDETYGLFATVEYALRAMDQNKFVVMNPWVNWVTTKMHASPNESDIKVLLDRRGKEISNCGLRNPNLRSAPDRDWTIIL